MASILIRIKAPASITTHDQLPDRLEGNAGGFHPCGMWVYVVDSRSFEWCGIQFYLSDEVASRFVSANPLMDLSVMRIRRLNEALDGKDYVEACAQNGTTHLLQVIWANSEKCEIIPALEFTDSWYASGKSKDVSVEARLEPSYEFCAIGICNVQAKLDQYGLPCSRIRQNSGILRNLGKRNSGEFRYTFAT